jgi:hypothetical protein
LQKPLPFLPWTANIDCSKSTSGARMNNLVGKSNSDNYFTDTVEACEAECGSSDQCNAFTWYSGTSQHGKCIMVSFCADYPKLLEGTDQNSSVSFKAGCNCIHHYPDIPCKCQKPEITFSYPNQNAGADAVYDPMNPSANNGGTV